MHSSNHRNFAARLLAAMGCVCLVLTSALASSQINFKDTWTQTGALDSTPLPTLVSKGTFSVSISLPLDGELNVGALTANSQFTLGIGPAGSPSLIISDILEDATGYEPGHSSAKFILNGRNSALPVGSVTLSWTASTLTITGTATNDILDEALTFQGLTTGAPYTSSLDTSVSGNYYEVVVMLDASSNNGGTFSYDNPYVLITGSDRETEYKPYANSLPIPLETGSIVGSIYQTNTAIVSVGPVSSAGHVTGAHTGEILNGGSTYTLTATPSSASWIFSEWTDAGGDVLSTNSTFQYTDNIGIPPNNDPETLQAIFVTNPFYKTGLAGTYTGLFYDTTNGASMEDSGYITVTVSSSGTYSGRIYPAGSTTSFPFSGKLAVSTNPGGPASGQSTIKISKTKTASVLMLFATDPTLTDSGAGLMSGYVTMNTATNSEIAEIQGALGLYNTEILPGVHNFALTPSADPSAGPGGYSYGTVTVSTRGTASISLHLADGTSSAISFSTYISRTGMCPLYASLYGGQGYIIGWLQFGTDGLGDMDDTTLAWVKASVKDSYYTTGFNLQPTLFGDIYVAPKGGSSIFGSAALELQLDPGYVSYNLGNEEDIAVTYNAAPNTLTDTSKIAIALTPSTGTVSASFPDPAGNRATFTFRGNVIDGNAYGYYVDSIAKETGPVTLVSLNAGTASVYLTPAAGSTNAPLVTK